MRERFASTGTTVALGVLAVLFYFGFVHLFAAWPPAGSFLLWAGALLARPDAPAWVQAVGSIVAIGAAAGIAWWQATSSRRDAERDRRRAETEKALAISFILRRATLVIRNAERAVIANSPGTLKLAREQVEMVQQTLRALPVFEIPSARLVFDLQRLDRDLLYVLRLFAATQDMQQRLPPRTGKALFIRVHRRVEQAQYACVTIFDHAGLRDAHLTGLGPMDDDDDDDHARER